MQKTLTLLSILLITMQNPIFSSTYYKSNALGQSIERIESFTGLGYEKESLDKDNYVVYLNGIEYIKREKKDGEQIDTFPDRVEKRFYEGENENLTRLIIETDNQVDEYNYLYNEDSLIGYSHTQNGDLVQSINYYRTTDGRLVALKGDKTSFIFSDGYGYVGTDGPYRLRLLPSGTLVRENDEVTSLYEFNDDNSWTEIIIENGKESKYLYSKDGRLMEEHTPSLTITNKYDQDGALIQKIEIRPQNRIISYFEGGIFKKSEEYENEELIKIRSVNLDGQYEEIRLEDGREKYKLIFDKDGERLLEINRL